MGRGVQVKDSGLRTHLNASYFTLVASKAALRVAPAHRHDRQAEKGQGRTQASSRWLRARRTCRAHTKSIRDVGFSIGPATR